MTLKRDPSTIGASDIPLICYWQRVLEGGNPPYVPFRNQGIIKLWQRCRTGEQQDEQSTAMSAGKAMELLLPAYADQLLSDEYGEVEFHDEPVYHPEHERLACTPDCLIGGEPGLELKATFDTRRADNWGGSDIAIPYPYFLQLQWSQYICGRETWHLVAAISDGFNANADMALLWAAYVMNDDLLDMEDELRDLSVQHYVIERDEGKLRYAQKAVAEFLDYVDAGERPEPVGLEGDKEPLREASQEVEGEEPRLVKTDQEEQWIREADEALARKKEAKKEYDEVKQKLQDAAPQGVVTEDHKGFAPDASGSFRPKRLG